MQASQRRKLSQAMVAAAGVAGALVRTLPGALGAASICVGLGMVFLPLAFIAAGAFLLVIDWRMP